jgi:uncharacterized repeat protein (TIGR01451 family)
LSVKITGPATATKGSTIAYTVVVTNKGPATARDGLVTLLVGPNTANVSTSPGPLIQLDGFWIWCLESLDPGASATFTVHVKTTHAGLTVGTAAAGSATIDPVLANNGAIVATLVR